VALLPNWALAVFRRRLKLRDAYKTFWRTPEGKAVLADLHAFCGMDHPIIATDDVNMTMSRLGARSVFLRIRRKARLTDEEIFAAVEAQAKEDTSDRS